MSRRLARKKACSAASPAAPRVAARPGRPPARERRQAHRRRPARPRRTLPLDAAVPRVSLAETSGAPSFRATSLTRWLPIAGPTLPWNAAAFSAASRPEVSLFYPLSNIEASETRYNADPQDILRVVRDLRVARRRFSRSTTPTLNGPRFPVRPTSKRTITATFPASSFPFSTTHRPCGNLAAGTGLF